MVVVVVVVMVVVVVVVVAAARGLKERWSCTICRQCFCSRFFFPFFFFVVERPPGSMDSFARSGVFCSCVAIAAAAVAVAVCKGRCQGLHRSEIISFFAK